MIHHRNVDGEGIGLDRRGWGKIIKRKVGWVDGGGEEDREEGGDMPRQSPHAPE